MNKQYLWLGVMACLALVGCKTPTSYPKLNQAGVSNATYVGSFSRYNKVYRTTYAVLNKYALIKHANFSEGRIVAEFLPNQEFLDPTRTLVEAQLIKRGRYRGEPRYYDVEVRCAKQIETSESNYFSKERAPYRWRTVKYDKTMEIKLLNRIKLALTGGGYLKKRSLAPRGVVDRSKPTPIPSSKKAKVRKSKTKPKVKIIKLKIKKKAAPKAAPKKNVKKVSEEFVNHNSTQANDDLAFRRYLVKGASYAKEGRWNMAVLTFRSALVNQPQSQLGYYYLTVGLLGKGEYNQAFNALAKGLSLKAKPDSIYLLELFENAHKFIEWKDKLGNSQEHQLLKAFLSLGIGRNKEARAHLNQVSTSYLLPYAKKLMLLAGEKNNPQFRKYY